MQNCKKLVFNSLFILLMGLGGLVQAESQNLYFSKLMGNHSWGGSSVWTNETGSYASFVDGDNVYIGFTTNSTKISVGNNRIVSGLYVNTTNYYEIRFKRWDPTMIFQSGSFAEIGRFEKRGSGELGWSGMKHTFTNDLHILEGVLDISPPAFNRTQDYAYPTDASILGSLEYPHTIYIGEGDPEKNARIEIYSPATKYLFCWEHQNPSNLLFVLNAGSLWFTGYGSRPVLSQVILKNGSDFGGPGNNDQRPRTMLNDDIFVQRGEVLEPSRINGVGSKVQYFLSSAGKTVTFDVEEVTSDVEVDGVWQDDGEADLIFDAMLADSENATWFGDPTKNWVDPVTNFVWSTKSPWIKTGAGTMQLPNSVARNSNQTGDIDIREGRVRAMARAGAKATTLGNPYAERTILIREGAELELGERNVLGAQNMGVIWDAYMTLVVSNGTLKATYPGDQYQMELYGTGQFLWKTGDYQNRYQFSLVGKNKFATDYPVVWTNNLASGSQNDYLDVFLDHTFDTYFDASNVECTNHYGFTEVNVAPVAVDRLGQKGDLVIAHGIQNRPDFRKDNKVTTGNNAFWCGLIKTGEGTLALTEYAKTHSGTIVREGGLWVECQMLTNVVVEAGGYLGGTGEVGHYVANPNNNNRNYPATLTFEEGAGLMVDATDPTTSLTVNGTIQLPRAGAVRIVNYTGVIEDLEIEGIALPTPSEAGEVLGLESVDASQWTASVEGYPERVSHNLQVLKEVDDTLTVRYRRVGTTLVIR